MIKSILSGTKTMTRRTRGLDKINENPNKYKPYERICRSSSGKQFAIGFLNKATKENTVVNVPYGYIGDVVYVKETFQHIPELTSKYPERYVYKADNFGLDTDKWKPSLFMPKQAARIFLEILDVRVERLQDISEEDAKAEGVEIIENGESYKDYLGKVDWYGCATNSFCSLWQKINGIESWNTNPFVFAYSFKVISTTGKP